MTNKEKFLEIYTKHLLECIRKTPRKYFYTAANVPDLALKIVEALANNSGYKDTDAIRATCKELEIKHNYSAIKAYLNAAV